MGFEGNHHDQSLRALLLTIVMGLYFTFLQGIEDAEATFRIADSVFGSVFFCSNGIPWSSCNCWYFILAGLFNSIKWGSFRSTHHFGLLAAIWYWHFVEIV